LTVPKSIRKAGCLPRRDNFYVAYRAKLWKSKLILTLVRTWTPQGWGVRDWQNRLGIQTGHRWRHDAENVHPKGW